MRGGLCTMYEQSPSNLCLGDPVARDRHVVIGGTLARSTDPSNRVCAHSVISMWHVVYLQHLVRACSEQSRSTSVVPINHVIQMPQCLSGFVNHEYCRRKMSQRKNTNGIWTSSVIQHLMAPVRGTFICTREKEIIIHTHTNSRCPQS